MTNRLKGLERACELAGSQAELARLIDVKPQTLSTWISLGFAGDDRALMIKQLYPEIPLREIVNPKRLKLLDALLAEQ